MTPRPGSVYVQVTPRLGDELVPGEWVSKIVAIHRMQCAIEQLRRDAAPHFDPSFGEQPPAILAPSEDELQASQQALAK